MLKETVNNNIEKLQRESAGKRVTSRSTSHYKWQFNDIISDILYQKNKYHDAERAPTVEARNEIQHKRIGSLLDRAHNYCFKENKNTRALYIDESIVNNSIFEHTITKSDLAYGIVNNYIEIDHAVFLPAITKLSAENDLKIKSKNIITNTNPVFFFERYINAGIDISTIKTFDGKSISADWTWGDHVEYFSNLFNNNYEQYFNK